MKVYYHATILFSKNILQYFHIIFSKTFVSNVQKITSAIFLLQFMFRSIAKNLTKEPCKDVVFILMCSMYFIT